jgi:hypothetical protein
MKTIAHITFRKNTIADTPRKLETIDASSMITKPVFTKKEGRGRGRSRGEEFSTSTFGTCTTI